MALVIGAAVGSFLNMLIWRLPRGLSFVDPAKSFCPKCKHSLGPSDLLPLLSWLLGRGRCRYCKEPIAVRYFLVELLTGTLFALLWWQYLIVGYEPVRMTFFMAATAALIAIIFIDWELYIIPDEINAFLLFLGIGLHWYLGSLPTAVIGAFWGWAILWGIAFFGRVAFGKDAMGDGDIKMMRGVGAIIGPTLLVANMGIAVLAGLIGGLVGIALESAKRKSAPPETEEEPFIATPTPIYLVLLSGVWYLLLLDIVSLFVKPLDRWIASKIPQEILEEDENWQPSFTQIPFGPYLAFGTIICMLFAGPIEQVLVEYWVDATGGATIDGR
jgi:leader peptidase (prepilin peptidase) / N-methyltransferase